MNNQGELTGFICVKLKEDTVWEAYIDSLHVSPTAQGRGTGKVLLQKAAQWILAKDANGIPDSDRQTSASDDDSRLQDL
ncbi:ribosomal protein S18 acetylase RimI-like enzyme [Erwinia rhapontici]|nr:ribosomal protein S18 acetylase RimI-like enzyme [Erwinia rhapontici]